MGVATQADTIFHKPYDGGHLYVLRYSNKNQKKHLTVDNCITTVDDTQKRIENTTATSFFSVSSIHSCKVLSFEGNDRLTDPLFNEIFDIKSGKKQNCYQTKRGVEIWSQSIHADIDSEIQSRSELGDSTSPNHGNSQEEFDVVKKRRMMESAVDNPNPDDSPNELERFEEFEQAVLPALMQIHGDDQNHRAVELVQLEKELQAGAVTTSGGVYIASCAAFSTYLKIGATRRSEPTQRLYEISRYVPVPFRLIAWIPSSFPFQLEAELHRHFETQRLKSNGAGTEFFKLNISVLMEVLSEFV